MAQIKNLVIAGVTAASMMGTTAAEAHHAYNPNGYTGAGTGYSTGGQDGGLPASVNEINSSTWSGPGLTYTGDLQAMWYSRFHTVVETHNLSTAETLTKTWDNDANSTTVKVAFPTNFELAVGAKSWEDTVGQGANKGWGHAMDFGLITLDHNETSFSITVSADNSALLPAFSFYKGWDQGGGLRHQAYVNNVDNPLGTTGLALLATVANDGDGSVTHIFNNLSAGNYSLFVGGDDGVAGGKYTVSMSAVPVPGAVWLFGSAIAGIVGFGRRKAAIAA